MHCGAEPYAHPYGALSNSAVYHGLWRAVIRLFPPPIGWIDY
jgi:hypothetical protein